MEFRFAGEGAAARPGEARIFCDGTADASYRDGFDLELSHWIPNRTPARYKADTSTAICLGFAADPLPGEWSLAVNNHVDTDGILSAFALTRPRIACAHREVLIQAAGMGDFMGWGELPAQRLYQGLGAVKSRLAGEGLAPQGIYERSFETVEALLEGGGEADEAVRAGLAALRESVRLVEAGEIERRLPHERLAVYVIPARLAEAHVGRALRVPGFDAPLSAMSLLLPQARARLDAQRLQLVSCETAAGWFHDLWLPGYAWAETPDSWRPPGLVLESSNAHRLELPAWRQAAAALQRREGGRGRWSVAGRVTPFETLPGRGFPVVLSCLRRGKPEPSELPPDSVARELVEAGVAG